MIGVEDGLRLRQVDHFVGALVPRQRDQPVEIGARHCVLGGRDRHLREPVELPQRLLLDSFRHAHGFDLLGQLLDFLRLVVAFSELLLNGLQLFAEEVIALVLADFGLHLRLNLRSELEHFELLDEDAVQVVHPCADVERLEDVLFDRRADRRKRRSNEVGQAARLADVRCERLEIVGQERRQRHHLLEVRLDVAGERVDLERIRFGRPFDGRRDLRAEVRMCGDDLVEREPRQTLDDEPQTAVRQLEHLVDVRRRADGVQIRLPRLFDRGVPLGEDGDEFAVRDRVVNQTDGAFARDSKRHERIGKKDGVPQRQNRQLGGNRERPVAGGQILRFQVFELIAHGDLTLQKNALLRGKAGGEVVRAPPPAEPRTGRRVITDRRRAMSRRAEP